ncbi:thioredoxin domain-containing protein [Rubritalea tangerina]|uniref:Thioredoxin domain-containing protein n=3 Tax=Rubritalea tangerina TaxID=430798 RepID=A0ABW4ZB19_9BACT
MHCLLCLTCMLIGVLGVWGDEVKENRLAGEASPYLRQHASNPVDWYPWGDEAFRRAKKENKPIFLSVGYATCHWCHVMERESFMDAKVAAYLNAHFISVKLDREERPDVDKVYMTALQAMTGEGGGWPLNVFLTPDLKPFYAGTYFPPVGRAGRPGFMDVLTQLQSAWEHKQDQVVSSAGTLQQLLEQQVMHERGGEVVPPVRLVAAATSSLVDEGDHEQGGWGEGPKFPMPSHLSYLLRARGDDEHVLEFVEMSARKMAAGGIYDQLGGGFHRYAVDGEWLVPHFEKMLYDQAQLLDLYVDLYLVTKKEAYAGVARGIADYVLEVMQDDAGGFYCAEDAQSEGKEGKFYCWTELELKGILEPAEWAVIREYYGISEKGNFYDHSDPEALLGQNVLAVVREGAWLNSERRMTLAKAQEKMIEARGKRVRPKVDDKVLASWNGMMIGSLARAGLVLDEEGYRKAARRAYQFVEGQMWDGKQLRHRWWKGQLDKVEQAESYVMMLQASRMLYEIELDPKALDFACALADRLMEVFYDAEAGGFYESVDAEDILVRLKGDFDGALPSVSSVAAYELLKLGEITGHKAYVEAAEKTLKYYADTLERSPSALTGMLKALVFYHGKKQRLVLVDGEGGLRTFLNVSHGAFRPQLTVMGNQGAVGAFERSLQPVDGRAAAYLCEGMQCQLPVVDARRLWKGDEE